MKIWIDGSGASLPGQKSKTMVVCEDGRESFKIIDGCTNNVAEYMALLEALEMAKPGDKIFTDSQLLVGHLVKNWNVGEGLYPLYIKALPLMLSKNCSLEWVSRKFNVAGKRIEKAK